MTSYSSNDFYQQWRFSLIEDFQTKEGHPYPYAEDASKQWGDEVHKISYPIGEDERPEKPGASALSHDGKYLAVSRKCDILVYNTESYKVEYTLKGHVNKVSSIAFRPRNSKALVSSAVNQANLWSNDTLTIFWDLDTYQLEPLLHPNNTSRISLAAVKSVATEIETLSSPIMSLTADEETSLTKSFEKHVISLINEKSAGKHKTLKGKIHQSFQSHAFSPSGHAMFYLPPGQRRSNGYDENWKLHVHSTDQHEDMFVLSGHTDSIMWAGFNHDETLIGTCGWDKSIRIWNATDGSQKYQFDTESQNWTGGFSPDGKYFLGTCGSGSAHVYNLSDGSEHMQIETEKQWCRAIAWHPSSSWFAIGARNGGRLDLIDVNTKQVFQRRKLGTETSIVDAPRRKFFGHWLELSTLYIVDGGRKIVFMVGADGSADVYDVEKECKWRFAREGVMGEPGSGQLIKSEAGHVMKVWEDKHLGLIRIATLDGDAVRFWEVPMTS